ncbi:hypothetical protein evm_009613 [Chilo suppressalis]|nr:hypothetical protein evm_009613 [Chilo suppressalis]
MGIKLYIKYLIIVVIYSVVIVINRTEVDPGSSDDFYKPFIKSGYKRLFPENAVSANYSVFVESCKEDEKLGNNNPIVTTNLFKNEIKGISNIRRVNPTKISVTAYIPAAMVETIGILRFVPTSISNEELFKKLSSPYEIVAVRRFSKKENGTVKVFKTVSLTFLSNVLPEHVFLDLFRFRVHEYNAPLLQCYKCFKFNHGAKICKSIQICSICSEEHHYSQCPDNTVVKCVNCQGPHLSISRDCPIKKQRMEEKKNKVSYANAILSNKNKNDTNLTTDYQNKFPKLPITKKTLPLKKTLNSNSVPSTVLTSNSAAEKDSLQKLSNEKIIDEIINNDFIRKAIVGALVAIGNDERALTSNVIQEILIKTLKKDQ